LIRLKAQEVQVNSRVFVHVFNNHLNCSKC